MTFKHSPKNEWYQREASRSLKHLEHLIEQVDGLVGIGLTDRLNFAQRADLSNEEKSALSQTDYRFNLANFDFFLGSIPRSSAAIGFLIILH